MDNPVTPGDVLLGKYRVERVLGKGGMGIVVAARHVDLGKLYAIKFLLPAMLAHRESLARFLREARAAARLQSEHVARVHDVGRMENGAPYMVMEYLDGCDLKALIARQGPLPVAEAVAYVLQVCDAIAEAHEAGIVHRDLKPANLFLVRRRNGSPCVKVLDFGISKHTGSEEVDLTSTNAMFGSPLYMSPEQMARTKTVDSRTDLWAIGVILYELLAGISPFKAAIMTEIISRVLQEEPMPLRELRPEVPPGVEAVIAQCLRKRREERFKTVEELVMALAPFEVVSAARAPMGSGTNVESAAGLGVVAPLASTSPLPAPDSPTVELTTAAWGRTGSATPRRQRMRWAWAAGASASLALGALSVWSLFKGSSTHPDSSASSVVPSAVAAQEVPRSIPPNEEARREAQEPLPEANPPSASTARSALAPRPTSTGKVTPPRASISTKEEKVQSQPPPPALPPQGPAKTAATAQQVKPGGTASSGGRKTMGFDD
ncbi:serine/threonine-protein kinase [Polyangium sorediatum]|uniref:Serine/threonine-protein kinase n=1 Tax=Polyangium sorediatum TaxID=889274 RepID=A0ABT6NN10_9BACT|nr:serine/threonine-protein kinase [Polyangium sorediatum]MDI1429693.1 serine/threonine-protein kinase [Polyangium sorediatum]